MNSEEGLVSRTSGGGGEWPTVCNNKGANDGPTPKENGE
jgi:hypothetical protein